MDVKFPNVKVKLTGSDGNAFAVMGKVVGALRKAGVSAEDIAAYRTAATSGDYNNLLAVTMKTVDVS